MAWDWEWVWDYHSREWTWRWIWQPDPWDWQPSGEHSGSWRGLEAYWTGGDTGSTGHTEAQGQSSAKSEGSGAQEPQGSKQEPPLKPETGGTSPFDAVGRGKSTASALRNDKALEAAYRRVRAARTALDPEAKRISRSSFARNRSRPPKSVREAKGRSKGQPDGQAQTASAEPSKAAPCARPAGVRPPPPGPRRDPAAAQGPGNQVPQPQTVGAQEEVASPDTTTTSSPTEPPAKAPKQTQAAPAPADDSTASSSSSDSSPPPAGESGGPVPGNEGEGDPPPQEDNKGDDMSAWSRRIVRKTSARKSRAQPPSSDEDKGAALPRAARAAVPATADTSTKPAGEVVPTPPTSGAASSSQTAPGHGRTPSAKAEEMEGATSVADAAPTGAEEATAPGTSPPSGDEELTLRVECRVAAFSTTISVKISPREIAAKLLRICWERTGLKSLDVLRVGGSELDLSLPLGMQLRRDERELQACLDGDPSSPSSPPVAPTEAIAAAGSSAEVAATPEEPPVPPVPVAGPGSSEGLSGSTPAGAVKEECEEEVVRPPLLSSDCLFCFACQVSAPSAEHMGGHLMTQAHVQATARFFGLRPP